MDVNRRRRAEYGMKEDPSTTAYDHAADTDYVRRNTRLQLGLGVLLVASLGWAIAMTAVYVNRTNRTTVMESLAEPTGLEGSNETLRYLEDKLAMVKVREKIYEVEIDMFKKRLCYRPTELITGFFAHQSNNGERVLFKVYKAETITNNFPFGLSIPRKNRGANGSLAVMNGTMINHVELRTSRGDWLLHDIFVADVDYNTSEFNHAAYDYFSVSGPGLRHILQSQNLQGTVNTWNSLQAQFTYPEICYAAPHLPPAAPPLSNASGAFMARNDGTVANITETPEPDANFGLLIDDISQAWAQDFTDCERIWYNGALTSYYSFTYTKNTLGAKFKLNTKYYVNERMGAILDIMPSDIDLAYSVLLGNEDEKADPSTWHADDAAFYTKPTSMESAFMNKYGTPIITGTATGLTVTGLLKIKKLRKELARIAAKVAEKAQLLAEAAKRAAAEALERAAEKRAARAAAKEAAEAAVREAEKQAAEAAARAAAKVAAEATAEAAEAAAEAAAEQAAAEAAAEATAEEVLAAAAEEAAAAVAEALLIAVCFPGHATADCESGSIRMEELRVGDRCRDGTGEFQTIYMISHSEATSTAAYVRLRTETNHTLELSAGHYLPVGGSPTRAESVRVGDVVETTGGRTLIASIEHVKLVGIFNPYTTSGSLIVNGVHALCCSDSFLDPYLPESAIPATWQVLLAPVRWLQWIAPQKMKRFHKDVNGMEMSGDIGRALASFVAA